MGFFFKDFYISFFFYFFIHINSPRFIEIRLRHSNYEYIILIKSNLLYLWPAYHSYGKISVCNHRLITFDANFSVFEKIDEVHNDYDNARKEMYEYKKQELKKGIDLL